MPRLKCKYVRISHSLPSEKPGTSGSHSSSPRMFRFFVGQYLGEYWSSDRHVARTPNLVSGRSNHSGIPINVETSKTNCNG